MIDINELKFSADGLIPAVVQDYCTKEVLTVAYLNREALEISLREGRTCFYSRSRNCLWRKGETSGNVQRIVWIKADCDRDALVVAVDKEGPACHLGTESCFSDYLSKPGAPDFSLAKLLELIKGRKSEMPAGSYTTYLFEKGLDKILKKIGEESSEVIIAAKNQNKPETVYEIADLVYHTLVLMAEAGIDCADIFNELSARHIIDKKTKQ
jgi:phosphoribosyl-ATP pyrophosphohydrolase/phosphoribosyl-AMP cyclohydrolase